MAKSHTCETVDLFDNLDITWKKKQTEVVTITHTRETSPRPGTLCGCVCIGRTLLRQRNRTNYKGPKINARLGLSVDSKIKKGQKTKQNKTTNCHFWRARSKSRGQRESRVLGLRPALSPPRVGGSPGLPLAQALGTVLAPHKDQLAPTVGSEQARGPVVHSWFSLCSRGPDEDLPEFLVWPFINFYWLRKPGTLDGNTGGVGLGKTQEAGKEMALQRWWGDWPTRVAQQRENTPWKVLGVSPESGTGSSKFPGWRRAHHLRKPRSERRAQWLRFPAGCFICSPVVLHLPYSSSLPFAKLSCLLWFCSLVLVKTETRGTVSYLMSFLSLYSLALLT